MSGQQYPDGYSPPFATASATDHTAWILIAATLGSIYSLLFGIIRAFIHYSARRRFGGDDGALVAGTAFGITQAGMILGACSIGLGKTIHDVSMDSQGRIQKMMYSSNLIFIVALGMSKISILFFLRRLMPRSPRRKAAVVLIGMVAIWTAASFLALAVQCDYTRPWVVKGEQCTGSDVRWDVISAFDILFEFAIVGLATHLVWGLQMPRSNKVTVVMAFAFRLFLLIPIGFRLAEFKNDAFRQDPTLHESKYLIWTQVELHYALISATIPCLRPMINDLVTYYGAVGRSPSFPANKRSFKKYAAYKMAALRPKLKPANVEEPVEAPPEASKAVVEELNEFGDVIRSAAVVTASTDSQITSRFDPDTISQVSNGEENPMAIKKHMSWKISRDQ